MDLFIYVWNTLYNLLFNLKCTYISELANSSMHKLFDIVASAEGQQISAASFYNFTLLL